MQLYSPPLSHIGEYLDTKIFKFRYKRIPAFPQVRDKSLSRYIAHSSVQDRRQYRCVEIIHMLGPLCGSRVQKCIVVVEVHKVLYWTVHYRYMIKVSCRYVTVQSVRMYLIVLQVNDPLCGCRKLWCKIKKGGLKTGKSKVTLNF